MKRKKIVENLQDCKRIVDSYYHGLSNAQIDEIVTNLQIALDKAIDTIKENKKLKEENETLKHKIKDLEFELEYGDPDGFTM